jgi:hypothetical protein
MYQGDKFGIGAHLDTETFINEKGIKHQSPLEKGRYNQHAGHIPKHTDGLNNVKRIYCK